ncbi:TetR family transcriptional regulator [Salmonella enterica]|nr:TetR family transcriptional regulator [Salmonella enterica]EGR8489985.1 TetR family transcriptional regulator [Salmonella enterica]EGR8499862.1 TetR family transcriptional regulator [Salmonella enterica]EHX9633451.1 TetR family transcriptional regulator [Salmonella enterica]EIE3088581.1 TetR family transcriptional regulator [Salmonella enterica]
MKTKRTDTRASLELALKRLQADVPLTVPKGGKISIAAVAREAGVSNATIHNRYPDIAEKIREMMKQTTSASPVLPRPPHDVAATLSRLRQENARLKSDLARSQSLNYRLLKENEALRASVKVP